MKLQLLLCAACLGLTIDAFALTLPEGIEIEPPSSLDLTYQVLPFYDVQEKVLARWYGDKLQFFVTIQPLPSEYTDPDSYIRGYLRDLKAALGAVDVGRKTTYQGTQRFKGTALEVSNPATGDGQPTPMVMHFITDGERTFLANATAVSGASITRDQLLQESVELLRTVHPAPDSEPAQAKVFDGSELVGNWVMKEKRTDGKLVVAQIHLKSDLSFACDISVDGQHIFAATGIWQRQGNEIHWTYAYSTPELPQSAQEDVDEILAVGQAQIVLKSRLTGKQRTMTRLPR